MDLFLVSLLAFPFALYAVVMLVRRARWRALAESLLAEQMDSSPFALGVIHGEGFHVEVRRTGRSFRTRVSVTAAATPGAYLLRAGFFSADPDWSAVRVPAALDQRGFVLRLDATRCVPPDDLQRRALLDWLDRETLGPEFAATLRRARIREIEVGGDTVSTNLRGIVSDREAIARTLDALGRLAKKEHARGVLASRSRQAA